MNNYCAKCSKNDFDTNICFGPGRNISLCIDRFNNFTKYEQNIHDSDSFNFGSLIQNDPNSHLNNYNWEKPIDEFDPNSYHLPVSIGNYGIIYPDGYNSIEYLYNIESTYEENDKNYKYRKFIPPPHYGLFQPICDKTTCIRNY